MNATPGPAGKRAGGTHLENPPHDAVGRGGAVFISYAHADNSATDPAARWLDRLLLNLKPLAFEELISVATDRDIGLGDDWHAQIQANLNRAGAAVLLVSPAYLASEYIRNNELPVLLHRAKTQGLRIVPVILRPCLFAETRFKYPHPETGPEEFSLASLQAAGSPAKALNEMTEGEQDRALLSVAQTLKRWVDGPHAAPSGTMGRAAASGISEPLSEFRDRLLAAGGAVPVLDEKTRQALLCHAPATVAEYRLARIAEWSQPRFDLDKRFTRLTLLLDQGPEAQGARWQVQSRPQPFDDLRDVLKETDATALVLLGPPGCGKSTLLRRLELDLALEALSPHPHPLPEGEGEKTVPLPESGGQSALLTETRPIARDPAPLSLFLPLSRYRPVRAGDDLPSPRLWLEREWAERYPRLPGLRELFRCGPFLLLLDGVNEIPHAGPEDYRERIGLWRALLADLAREAPGVRAVFTCRSLDYSALLSTRESPVPQVRIEPLEDARVEQFLGAYDPDRGPRLWRELRGTPQLELFRSPFYLRLLLAHRDQDGRLSKGRAALFTGFVRQALRREIEAGHPLFQSGALLDRRDYERVLRGEWRDGFELPAREPALCAALSRLAYRMQKRRGAGDASRVRVGWDEALLLLGGGEEAEHLVKGGEALHVIEEQWDDVLFVHQLFQEYFAAREVAARLEPELTRVPWRAAEMAPSLEDTLAALADSDPLPAAPATGWEETFVLAAAMAADPAAFVAALELPNLPLAGRCAAQADVAVPPAHRQRLQQALISRSRDPKADLRARIAAARALGDLGDPRFERRRGPDGDYLLPPLLPIEGGDYPLGSDEGLYQDEAPAHTVTLASYAIGRFPVTNAEWQCFLEAGGYEDERFWDTEAGRRWRRGEDTAEGPKQQWRDNRRFLQDNPDWIGKTLAEARITSKQAENYRSYRTIADAEFEVLLGSWYPPGRQTRPAFWDDPAFNHPAQPVVGISWHEARAYCAWLSVESRQAFRLPTEAEWEAAARGREGRRYPWGAEFDPARCNAFETHVRATTPVGVFPGGDSPEGVADLAGNVWEWTGSVYSPYRYRAEGGRENPEDAEARRVVRGGSWYGRRGGARSACRSGLTPGRRDLNLGLRLVCVAPIA